VTKFGLLRTSIVIDPIEVSRLSFVKKSLRLDAYELTVSIKQTWLVASSL